MPQGNVNQDTGHSYTTTNTGLKYRTTNSGNPLAHDDVDANFELLRSAINGLVADHASQASDLTTLSNSIGSNDTDISALQSSVATNTTNIATNATDIATNASGISTNATAIASNTTAITNITDGTTAVPIADGSVTEAKIAAGAVTLNKLDTNISTQLKVVKTVFVHVGNYYKNGDKYWASDAYNYNTTSGRYDPRGTIVLPYNHAEIPFLVWGAYHSTDDAAIITEPFATVCAAARYVLHNHGHDCVIGIIVHGHVAWHGSYDASGSEALDVRQWESVKKLAITGGRSDDTTGSHYSTFPSNGFSSARIDVSHATSSLYAPACWIRNARVIIEGICFTHKHITNPRTHMRGFRIGGESKMFSQFSSIRMNAIDQIASQNDYFYPWSFGEGGSAYFSSGGNQPHELWTQGNMTLFQAEQDAYMLYSNNAGSNQLYLHTVGSNASIRTFGCVDGGKIFYRHSSILLKTGSNIPSTNINTAGFHHAFNNLRIDAEFSTNNQLYFPGNLQTAVTQYGGQSGSTNVYINSANEGGNYNYSDISFGSARTNAVATNSPRYYGSSYPSNTLYGKFHTQANNSSLSKSTLVGDGSTQNFKSAPSARTGDGGTNSNNAPYSDQ